MSASPQWKVYNPQDEYVAACKHLEDAAALVALYGDGAQIRGAHAKRWTVWREGEEEFRAGESYDRCREYAELRWAGLQRAAYESVYGAKS